MKFKIFLIIFQLIQSENVKLRNNDYIFDLTKSKPTTTGLAGEARSANIDSMPILQGKGVSNVLFHIHACAVNLHNIHPRSSELLFVISGIFRVAFVEENNGRILINKIRTGQVTLFPQV